MQSVWAELGPIFTSLGCPQTLHMTSEGLGKLCEGDSCSEKHVLLSMRRHVERGPPLACAEI